jgi:hypothetical protein
MSNLEEEEAYAEDSGMEGLDEDGPGSGSLPYPSDYCLLVRQFSGMGFGSSLPASLAQVLASSREVLTRGNRCGA